jgi:hypothetical protein
MAEIIPDQILDAALKEIANFSDAEARAEIDRISVVQPALIEYFIAMTEDSSEDVQSFASAIFIAIHKVFEKQFGPLQKVGTKRVEQIADRNEQAMIYLRIRQPEEEGFVSAAMGPLHQPAKFIGLRFRVDPHSERKRIGTFRDQARRPRGHHENRDRCPGQRRLREQVRH